MERCLLRAKTCQPGILYSDKKNKGKNKVFKQKLREFITPANLHFRKCYMMSNVNPNLHENN